MAQPKSAEALRREAMRWNARTPASDARNVTQLLLEAAKRYQARASGGSEIDSAIRGHLVLFSNCLLEVLAEEDRQRQQSLSIVG